MTEADFVDTFIKPAIDLMVASSEAVAGDYGGTFTIHTGTSLTNHTLISSTAVFIDTRQRRRAAGEVDLSVLGADHD